MRRRAGLLFQLFVERVLIFVSALLYGRIQRKHVRALDLPVGGYVPSLLFEQNLDALQRAPFNSVV